MAEEAHLPQPSLVTLVFDVVESVVVAAAVGVVVVVVVAIGVEVNRINDLAVVVAALFERSCTAVVVDVVVDVLAAVAVVIVGYQSWRTIFANLSSWRD